MLYIVCSIYSMLYVVYVVCSICNNNEHTHQSLTLKLVEQ